MFTAFLVLPSVLLKLDANNSFIFSNPKVCSFSQKNGLTFDDSGDKIVVKCIACRGSRFRKKISLTVVKLCVGICSKFLR